MIDETDSEDTLSWFKAEEFDELEYLADIKHIVNNDDLAADQKIKSIKVINEKVPKTEYDKPKDKFVKDTNGIEIKEVTLKPVKLKYFEITQDILDNLKNDIKIARQKDALTGNPMDYPVNTWLAIKKYHGLLYDNEYGIIENYGTPLQTRINNIHIGDYVIESNSGYTKLIQHNDFKQCFKGVSNSN